MGPFLDGKGEPLPREKTVYELKGIDFVYLIDYCGALLTTAALSRRGSSS
jgi:hypothetical protein